ncbi:MAG TPA: hypothetical protein VMZ92_11140 [Planctomycetota bacterium]|nr:hypothetical protein [Planctomycetota bacterium]
MHRLLAVCVVLAMAGCGGDVASPEVATTADIRARTLKRVKALEEQAAKDDVKAKDVRELAVSLKYLIGHMQKEKVGTTEQVETLTALNARLMQGGAAPALPPRDWRPDTGQTPTTPKLDTQPLKDLLPDLRKALEAVR